MGWLDMLRQDVRYAVRGLRRNPILTSGVVITLMVGIGLNTAVFSVLNGMVFRSRIEKDPDRFVQVLTESAGLYGTSLADYQFYRARANGVTDLAAWTVVGATLNDDPSPDLALLVTCDFFRLYGLEQAGLGRLFRAEECAAPLAAPVAVISEELWRRAFSSSPAIIGATILVKQHPFQVVGVAPARFSGRLRGQGIWLPFTMQPLFYGGRDFFREPAIPWLTVEGRMKPGYSRREVAAEFRALAAPGRSTTVTVTNGSFFEHPGVRPMMLFVVPLWMGALTLVLLLACTNVTMLLLSRAAARRQEIAIRLALGASRQRLVAMLLTEGLVLASAAAVFCAYFAYQVPVLFEKVLVSAPHYPVQPDWLVFAYLAGITLLAGCIAGLAPAAESFKTDLTGSLKGQVSFFRAPASRWRTRDLLIGAQVAMSLVLLVGAGLFVRAQRRMAHGDSGMPARQLLSTPFQVKPADADATLVVYRQLETAARALPGVRAASYANAPPGTSRDAAALSAAGRRTEASVSFVSPDFFATVQLPILRGRGLQGGSDVVVSETLARLLWPGGNAVGQAVAGEHGDRFVVAGVARDAKRFNGDDTPRLYRLPGQRYSTGVLMVRFEGDAAAVERGLSGLMRNTPGLEGGIPRTFQSIVDEMASRLWVMTAIVMSLASIALVLAVIGVYGVVAFAVTRRTRELGIRLALGATRRDIVRTVLGSGVKPIVAGLLIGSLLALVGSVALARVLKGSPAAIDTRDPLVYSAVALVLATAALAAMFRPALRAAKADPADALRQD